MVARLSANEHKKLLEEALVGNITYKLLGGTMPYQILLQCLCEGIVERTIEGKRRCVASAVATT